MRHYNVFLIELSSNDSAICRATRGTIFCALPDPPFHPNEESRARLRKWCGDEDLEQVITNLRVTSALPLQYCKAQE